LRVMIKGRGLLKRLRRAEWLLMSSGDDGVPERREGFSDKVNEFCDFTASSG
jgi:hypothetical protein